MTEQQIKAIEAIEQQQPKERTAVWMVGEQLKDICRNEPESAALILHDLEVKEMGIKFAEKKIKEFADKHKTGNFACVIPAEADRILRKFYGLPELGQSGTPVPTEEKKEDGVCVNLLDFL